MEKTKQQEETFHVEGIGNITYVGELNFEKLIKRLLKSKFIIEG